MAGRGNLANLRNWKPGQSGNQNGRPRKYCDLLRLTRAATPEAVKILKECMRDTQAPWPARVTAATALLDRAWGKPKEHVEVESVSTSLLRIEIVDPNGHVDETITINGSQPIDGEAGPATIPLLPFDRSESDEQ